ncbi:MAG: riboflavin synthase [Bacteroidetes bacterium]|nr:riboflavin synthase [Bacteroidota bacterium]
MFTGIVEQTGIVKKVIEKGSNRSFWIKSKLAKALKPDQSVSHNGVCLTVEEIKGNSYRITAIDETLKKTNLGQWEEHTLVNLERCLQMNGRIDGHIVQGHVDTVATCTNIVQKEGSWELDFRIDPQFANLIIEKGSITLNGISLTIFNVGRDSFTVAIIPYTYEHTNIGMVTMGDQVNIEFDMIGKYVNRINQLR